MFSMSNVLLEDIFILGTLLVIGCKIVNDSHDRVIDTSRTLVNACKKTKKFMAERC